MEPNKTFVLDGVRYEIDSLPAKAKNILQLITEFRQTTETQIQMAELAIDRLTSELKSMNGEFVVVPEETEAEVEGDKE